MTNAERALMEALLNAAYEAEDWILSHPAQMWQTPDTTEIMQTLNDAITRAEQHGVQKTTLAYAAAWDAAHTETVIG